MREELAVENLMDVKEVFDERGIRYWLDWGTLLGAVREGKMIEWDHDIDLGTMDDNLEKIVSIFPELEKRGFSVMFINLPFREGIYFERFGCHMCIIWYRVKGKYALSGILIWPKNLLAKGLYSLYSLLLFPKGYLLVSSKFQSTVRMLSYCLSLLLGLKKPLSDVVWLIVRRTCKRAFQIIIPKRYFEKLGTIKFCGMTFNTPSNVEDYLKYHYGKDWKTPKKEWKFEMDGAVRELCNI
jgi:lipopolysaccharide cholinephosphotransferase